MGTDVAFEVTAVVLSHNRADLLSSVVRAVVDQVPSPGRVVLVENGSTDGSEAVASAVPGVAVMALAENVGVGAGHTVGWQEALRDPNSTFVWVLEHDTLPQPGCLHELLARWQVLTDSGVRVGAVAARLERDEAEAAARLEWDIPLEPRSIDRFTFNGVLLSREAIEAVGYPRADFFVGQEDWDYSARLVHAGFAIWEEPFAVALHGTKGDGRYGIRPTVARSYYANRNWLALRCHEERGRWSRLRVVLWSVGAIGRTLLHEDAKVRRVCARVMACFDALAERMGRREYWFFNERVQRERGSNASR